MGTELRTSSPVHVRLGPVDSQRVFRQLLEAFARPGTLADVSTVAAAHDVEPMLLPALALADLDVLVGVIGATRSAELADMIRRSTGAVIVDDLVRAELVVAADAPTCDEISRISRGSALAPELGARLVIACEGLAAASSAQHDLGGVDLVLSGPGARDGRAITVAGIDSDVFTALQSANADHPAGIDTWLIDTTGHVVGIPRSSRIVRGGH